MSPERTVMPPSGTIGTWVLVVGPSGAGKDTLLDLARNAVTDLKPICFAKRVVTRPANDFEDHDSVDADQFERMQADGAFALSWQAHGLSYGVPAHWHEQVRRRRDCGLQRVTHHCRIRT